MNSPTPALANESPEEQGFRLAYEQAQGSFLAGLKFSRVFTSSLSTQVFADESSTQSTLYINLDTPLVRILAPTMAGGFKDAWLLVLAHESAHLRINATCIRNGDNPASPDVQLKAIGLDPAKFPGAADFQKETAIETHCDAVLVESAFNFLGTKWRAPIQTLCKHREMTSKRLGLFDPDEFATFPALKIILDQNVPLNPLDAAEIALSHSLRHTSAIKKSAVATAEGISETKKSWANRLERWRVKHSNSDGAPPKGPTAG